jgi:hypothetical protein
MKNRAFKVSGNGSRKHPLKKNLKFSKKSKSKLTLPLIPAHQDRTVKLKLLEGTYPFPWLVRRSKQRKLKLLYPCTF